MKPKHPVMNIELADGQQRLRISENAFIYLQSKRIHKLRFTPFADWKTRFMLYLDLALANGESFVICCRSCFDGDWPRSFKHFATGQDPRHYFHEMLQVLAKLLDGTRATVVVQSAKTLEMIYNTCGWLPQDMETLTGRYSCKPPDNICYSWFTNDDVVFAMYADQKITDQPLN